jgi:hypothetical protein
LYSSFIRFFSPALSFLIHRQTDATRAELEESQAQQRIVDAKRVQLVKELRRQLKQELLINREMQVTIRCQQDELGDARNSNGNHGMHGGSGGNGATVRFASPQPNASGSAPITNSAFHRHSMTAAVDSLSFSQSAALLASPAPSQLSSSSSSSSSPSSPSSDESARASLVLSPQPPSSSSSAAMSQRRHTAMPAYSSAQFLNPPSQAQVCCIRLKAPISFCGKNINFFIPRINLGPSVSDMFAVLFCKKNPVNVVFSTT